MMVLSTKRICIDRSDIRAVLSCLRSKDLSGSGEAVTAYENNLTDYFRVDYALACSSGTSAIYLGLLALKIGRGDEVILPATAPVMSGLPILALGARPIFADVTSISSFALCTSDIMKKQTRRTKAIICVPMWGYPIEASDYKKLIRSTGLPILDDCAQAHGSSVNGALQGSFASISAFSTHERKLICTGEGGFVLTNEKLYYDTMFECRAFGRPQSADDSANFGERFGMNCKLAAPLASLGSSQLGKLDVRIDIRRKNAAMLRNLLQEFPQFVEPDCSHDANPNYYAMALIDTSEKPVAKILNKKLFDKGVISDSYRYRYMPTYGVPIFQKYAVRCENAEELCSRIVTLPVHEEFNENWRTLIYEAFLESVQI
jgi:perosamine synthetase